MEAEMASASMQAAKQVREAILAHPTVATALATTAAFGVGVGYYVYSAQHGARSKDSHKRKKSSRSARGARNEKGNTKDSSEMDENPSSIDSRSDRKQNTTPSSEHSDESNTSSPKKRDATPESQLPTYGPPEVPQVTSMLGRNINSCPEVTMTITGPDTATSDDFASWSKRHWKGKTKCEEDRLPLPRPCMHFRDRERERVLREAKARMLVKKRAREAKNSGGEAENNEEEKAAIDDVELAN